MHSTAKLFLIFGAVSAALSVVLGAVGAHAMGAPLAEAGARGWFQTALQYQQFHALGLLAVGMLLARNVSAWLVASGWLMVAGTLLFSGSLYLRSLADFHALHAATPFGGLAFILGWIVLALGVWRQK